MKKIILTGGGTAGHVMPNLALVPELEKNGYEIEYIGGKRGIERDIISKHGIPFYGISAGKLRRYADVKNITDMFRVVKGLRDAYKLIKKLEPDVVFSKGGFVTVPVVMAARLCGVKTVIHESDITPGLANKLALPFAHTVCVSFPETLFFVKKGNLTGTPIRAELLNGEKATGRRICGFESNYKPVLLVTGGSLGAAAINKTLRETLPQLLEKYRVIHLCGKGNLSGMKIKLKDYAEFEFVKDEMPHLYALADIIISRAGANTIFEILALQKPNLLIPLSKKASRGDQILNAASFKEQGFSKVLSEDEMNPKKLIEAINALYDEREIYANRMMTQAASDGVGAVTKILMA